MLNEAYYRHYGADPDDLVILFVGRFTADKQPMDAIRPMDVIRQTGRDVRMVMVGEGPARSQCEAYSVSRSDGTIAAVNRFAA